MFSDLQDNVWFYCFELHTLGLSDVYQTCVRRANSLETCFQQCDRRAEQFPARASNTTGEGSEERPPFWIYQALQLLILGHIWEEVSYKMIICSKVKQPWGWTIPLGHTLGLGSASSSLLSLSSHCAVGDQHPVPEGPSHGPKAEMASLSSGPAIDVWSSSPSSNCLCTLSGLSSSKRTPEERDANYLSGKLIVSVTWHQAVGSVGREKTSLISLGMVDISTAYWRIASLLLFLPMEAELPTC